MEILLGISLLIEIIFIIVFYKWFGRKTKCVGTIVVDEQENKIFYTLELDVDPEKIRFEKKVVFKVENKVENSVRK